MLVYQRVPQQEWHIDGEFNEVVPRSLGSMTASERIQVVLRLRSRSGSRLSQGLPAMPKTDHDWGWFLPDIDGDDLGMIYDWVYHKRYKKYIYEILYYAISNHIILYHVILYHIISYYIILCSALYYILYNDP